MIVYGGGILDGWCRYRYGIITACRDALGFSYGDIR
jgi:hypothetical protein